MIFRNKILEQLKRVFRTLKIKAGILILKVGESEMAMNGLTPGTKLTPHVTVGEYSCRCGCGFGMHLEEIDWDVLHCFEAIRREAKDYPFIINSGCRCPSRNASVGGAKDSPHLRCSALDLFPVGGWRVFQEKTGLSRDDFIEICVKIIGDGGVGYEMYGKYGIVHIDRDRKLMALTLSRRW